VAQLKELEPPVDSSQRQETPVSVLLIFFCVSVTLQKPPSVFYCVQHYFADVEQVDLGGVHTPQIIFHFNLYDYFCAKLMDFLASHFDSVSVSLLMTQLQLLVELKLQPHVEQVL
jgi:hypothetical protein